MHSYQMHCGVCPKPLAHYHCSITWHGRQIHTYDDWDNDRGGHLVFDASRVAWDGTVDGLPRTLIAYLDALPEQNECGWPKTTIEKLGLSGDLRETGAARELVVFPMRSVDK